jgi:hypothetical protein
MLVIPVDRVVDKKIIVGKNGGQRRKKGTRGCILKKAQSQRKHCLLDCLRSEVNVRNTIIGNCDQFSN